MAIAAMTQQISNSEDQKSFAGICQLSVSDSKTHVTQLPFIAIKEINYFLSTALLVHCSRVSYARVVYCDLS